MASPFVPKGREELLLRTPLTFGFSAPSSMYQPRNNQDNTAVRNDYSAGGSREQQRAKIKRMSRNTPHTSRVRPIKGLTNDPICSVEDNTLRPRPMSALTNRDLGSGYRPPGSSRYSANTNKHLFAVGVVPITYAWRDELLKKAQKAISKALGQDASTSLSSTRPGSRLSSRGQPRQFDHLEDGTLLDMMCQLLHTDSIPRCQEWINIATEDEKDVVLNMIRLAALGGEGETDLPSRPPSRYVWQPSSRQSRRHSDPLLGESLDLLSLNTHPRYLLQQGSKTGGGGEGGGERRGGRREGGGEGGGERRGGRGGGGGEGGGERRGERRGGEKGILPKISHTHNDNTQMESTSGQGGRRGGEGGKKKALMFFDATTQLDDPERDIADSSTRKTKEREKKRKINERREKNDANILPPLHHSKQQEVKGRHPHSERRSARTATGEHCVTGGGRGGPKI